MGEFAKKVIWERGDSELWTRVSTAAATTSKRSWHKVTVDGGLSRDGSKRATAAVCRTEHAQFLGASVNVLDGHNDPACLEALACNEGLALASSRSGHWYSVFGFGLFRDGDKLPKEGVVPPCSAILREVEQRDLHLRQVEVVHEKRETTVEAHILAKAASSLDACRYVRLGSLHDICCIPLTSFQLNKEPYSTQKKLTFLLALEKS